MPGTKFKFDITNLHSKDPFKQFDFWMQEAKQSSNIKNPTVMCLATCSINFQPSCRMIQLQDYSDKGFLFFTHYDSKKATELAHNRRCSMCFYWDQVDRQVVIKGKAQKISEHESLEYFSRRPMPQQLKTLASVQGKVIKDKDILVERQKKLVKEFEETKRMPVPEAWCGYLFVPEEFDFWQGCADELDDRIRFRKRHDNEDQTIVTPGEGSWVIERLGA